MTDADVAHDQVTSQEIEWHRPHPLSVLVFIVDFVAKNAFALIFVFFVGSGRGFGLVGVAVAVAPVLVGIARWRATRYAVTADRLEHRQGIFRRSARSLPRSNIQQVSITEPLLARIVNLSVVQISEASADGDVNISYLDIRTAEELIARLAPRDPERAAETDTPVVAPPVQIFQTAPGDLLRWELARATPVAVALAAFGTLLAGSVALRFGALAGIITLAVVIGAVGVQLLMRVLSAHLALGEFTVTRTHRGLVVDAGILTKRHLDVRPDRIQTVSIRSGPFTRVAGLEQVVFSAAVGAIATGRTALSHLAPAVPVAHVDQLLAGAINSTRVDEALLLPVSPVTVRRTLVRASIVGLLVIVPAAVAAWIAVHPLLAVSGVTAWLAASRAWAHERHRRLGYSIDDERLNFRGGVIGHHLILLRLANVQAVRISRTFFQRRLGVASVLVTTAGIGPHSHVRIPDLDSEEADRLALALAGAAAARPWELTSGGSGPGLDDRRQTTSQSSPVG